MNRIEVVGMDPSLTNWGMARGTYEVSTQRLDIHSLEVISPKFTDSKQVRQNSKDLERANQLAERSGAIAATGLVVFVEVPVGSQSARAMASYGVCVGVLGALRAQGISFYEITPTEVKRATVGKDNASKAAIIERAVSLYPDAPWPYRQHKGKTQLITGQAEHMADAIGAIEAGVLSEPFKQMLSVFRAA